MKKKSLKQMKNNKAIGPDRVIIKIIKRGGSKTLSLMET